MGNLWCEPFQFRNRDKQLQSLIENCKKNSIQYSSSSLIRSLEEFSDLGKIKEDFQKANNRLIKKLQEMEDNLHKDPIFKSFLELYNDPEVIKYERNDDIIKSAQNRKLIGNPPKPQDHNDNSIGDEINWEIIISKLTEDLVIITRDKTYEDHVTFLKNEFNSKTGKELFIDKNISFALKKMGEISSSQLIKLEEEQKEKLLTSGCTSEDCPDDCYEGDCPDDCYEGDCPDDCYEGDCPDDCYEGDCPDDCYEGDCPDGDCPDGDCPDGDCPDGDCPDGDCPDN
jgi:hypothetical protein